MLLIFSVLSTYNQSGITGTNTYETIIDFFSEFSSFDTIYLFITLWTLFECTKKGFLLSILSASKWLLAYVITLFLFPKAKPYVDCLLYTSDAADE
mgnify:CR=1 FL=1